MFLAAFFNEELSAGLMGPAASETLSKCCVSSEVVAEMFSYRAQFCLGSWGLSAPVQAPTAAGTKDFGGR